MYLGPIEERQIRNNEIKLVTAALYEAKVKDEEVLRVLMKVCEIDRERAMSEFQNEKFLLDPCRKLRQYLLLQKGFDRNDTDVFIHTAKKALARNPELRKLSPDKLFDAINKTNK
ncbi:hypothetical protein [Bacillus sp. AK031]